MSLSLKPSHLKRYRDILRLFFRYGRGDLVRAAELEEGLEEVALLPEAAARAEDLAADLEIMGPTFIKLGQLLSTRADLLPPPYIQSLTRLRDHVDPVPTELVLNVIEEELGVKLSRAFPDFDVKPLASASLGQVHRARLRDGREVVVKVQRPDVRRQVQDDMEALGEIATLLDRHTDLGRRVHLQGLLEEFRRSLFRELDYRQEAQHLLTIAENLKEFDRILVPRPMGDFSSTRVLTMDYIAGFKVSDLNPLARVELDGATLADQLFRAYLKQILVDGFLHADPHPGNVFVTEDGRIALLDLGMVVRLSPVLQNRLVTLILAIAEGRADEAAESLLDLSETKEGIDRGTLVRRLSELLGRFRDSQLKDLNMGRVLVEITRSSIDCGLRLPSEFSMVGQTLLKLDAVGRILAPEFNTKQAIRDNALTLLHRRLWREESLGGLFKTAVAFKEFAAQFPARAGRILDLVADNRLKLAIDAIDEQYLMQGLQKIANRITLGLILAASIIGAALLMRIETSFRLFGYPALAMLLFLGAAAGIALLAFHIVFRDDRSSGPPSDKGAP
ncbi:MAG TPA: AarF/UbiB family protein [Planctomycetota bacterium]|nr:AarF/UbiB family protein [Planctomycetota bacterium]